MQPTAVPDTGRRKKRPTYLYALVYSSCLPLCRNRTGLTAENLKHLEKVFRENLAKDKKEFTLAEFKKIVPSKNVSIHPSPPPR